MQVKIRLYDTGAVLYTANIHADEKAPEGYKKGLAVQEAFRNGVDLSGAELADVDLSGMTLPRIRLNGAHMPAANLLGTVMPQAALEGAQLAGAWAVGTNLEGADLSYTVLRNANMTGANLSGANCQGMDARRTNFSGAILQDADCRSAILLGCNFDRADFRNVRLETVEEAQSKKRYFGITGDGDRKGSYISHRLVSFFDAANVIRASFSGARTDGTHFDFAQKTSALNLPDRPRDRTAKVALGLAATAALGYVFAAGASAARDERRAAHDVAEQDTTLQNVKIEDVRSDNAACEDDERPLTAFLSATRNDAPVTVTACGGTERSFRILSVK